MKANLRHSLVAVCLAAGVLSATAGMAPAKHGRVIAGGPANVHVWVDGGDVFAGYGDVTIWVRADRDCYSTLFMVDTAGYIHVLSPNGCGQDGWLAGGRSYCYRACDLGLDRLDGHGVAYVFAVGSPVPFDYSYYGAGVFAGGFGFRVAGDPFVACREFYMSMLPAGCRWDFVGVGYTRFYVREWVRYPSYLCAGGPGFHVRVGDACRVCADAYASYRGNAAAPWDAMRPVPRARGTYGARTIQRASVAQDAPRQVNHERSARASKTVATMGPRAVGQERVVSTSRSLERGLRGATKSAWNAPARSRDAGRDDDVALVPRARNHDERDSRSAGAPEKGGRRKSRQAQ